MIWWILWPIIKYVFYALLVVLVYNLYAYFYIPWAVRSRFSKYANVHMSEQHVPLYGDASKYMEDVQNGRVSYYHQIEYSQKLKDIDLRVSFVGKEPYVNLFSFTAIKEFIDKTPKYFDRHGIPRNGFGKLFPTAFINNKSDDNWKSRRENTMKEIGINFSSKYIPTMIDAIGGRVETWRDGKIRNLIKEMSDATFEIITNMLFGKNIIDEVGEIEYLGEFL
jgi:hypothetical protein